MSQLHNKPNLTRKEFLRLASMFGLAAAISSIIEGCSPAEIDSPTSTPLLNKTKPADSPTTPPTATSTSAPTVEPSATSTSMSTAIPDSEMAKVSFVMTTDRSEGVRKAIDLLGINPVNGKSVFLKPNFNSSDPAPGSTHPDVLRTVISKLREMGANEITVGDRSGMGGTKRVMEALGIYGLSSELGFDVIDLGVLGSNEWKMVKPPDGHWKVGFPFARPCLQTDTLVQTCCLKTHAFGGHFTMSLKNSVGMVATGLEGYGIQFMDELHSSAHQRKMIAEINTAYAPGLIILDGVEAFTAGGPAQGRLVAPEVVLAGTDRIAVDAAGVALLRYFKTTLAVSTGPIFQQQQIARAAELGLGIDNPYKIELVTGDSRSAAFAEKIQNILVQA